MQYYCIIKNNRVAYDFIIKKNLIMCSSNTSSVEITKINNISNFRNNNSYLSIVERKTPQESKEFFKILTQKTISISGEVFKKSCMDDIQILLNEITLNKLRTNLFYKKWIKDMAKISSIFCDILNTSNISFSLETSRSCKRYHIDNVPVRLLVTYYGKGTEWAPRHACNYSAYYRGEKNEKIINNFKEIRYIKNWNIAIFKGQKFNGKEKGILHRTPDDALNHASLLMRLDHPSYLSQ